MEKVMIKYQSLESAYNSIKTRLLDTYKEAGVRQQVLQQLAAFAPPSNGKVFAALSDAVFAAPRS